MVCAFNNAREFAWVEQEIKVSLPVFGFACQELGVFDHLKKPLEEL
jgi:hypothetical protein